MTLRYHTPKPQGLSPPDRILPRLDLRTLVPDKTVAIYDQILAAPEGLEKSWSLGVLEEVARSMTEQRFRVPKRDIQSGETPISAYVRHMTLVELEDHLPYLPSVQLVQKEQIISGAYSGPDNYGTPARIWQPLAGLDVNLFNYTTYRASPAYSPEKNGPWLGSGRDPVHNWGIVFRSEALEEPEWTDEPRQHVHMCCGQFGPAPGCWIAHEGESKPRPYDILTNTRGTAWLDEDYYDKLHEQIQAELLKSGGLPTKRALLLEDSYNQVFCQRRPGLPSNLATDEEWARFIDTLAPRPPRGPVVPAPLRGPRSKKVPPKTTPRRNPPRKVKKEVVPPPEIVPPTEPNNEEVSKLKPLLGVDFIKEASSQTVNTTLAKTAQMLEFFVVNFARLKRIMVNNTPEHQRGLETLEKFQILYIDLKKRIDSLTLDSELANYKFDQFMIKASKLDKTELENLLNPIPNREDSFGDTELPDWEAIPVRNLQEATKNNDWSLIVSLLPANSLLSKEVREFILKDAEYRKLEVEIPAFDIPEVSEYFRLLGREVFHFTDLFWVMLYDIKDNVQLLDDNYVKNALDIHWPIKPIHFVDYLNLLKNPTPKNLSLYVASKLLSGQLNGLLDYLGHVKTNVLKDEITALEDVVKYVIAYDTYLGKMGPLIDKIKKDGLAANFQGQAFFDSFEPDLDKFGEALRVIQTLSNPVDVKTEFFSRVNGIIYNYEQILTNYNEIRRSEPSVVEPIFIQLARLKGRDFIELAKQQTVNKSLSKAASAVDYFSRRYMKIEALIEEYPDETWSDFIYAYISVGYTVNNVKAIYRSMRRTLKAVTSDEELARYDWSTIMEKYELSEEQHLDTLYNWLSDIISPSEDFLFSFLVQKLGELTNIIATGSTEGGFLLEEMLRLVRKTSNKSDILTQIISDLITFHERRVDIYKNVIASKVPVNEYIRLLQDFSEACLQQKNNPSKRIDFKRIRVLLGNLTREEGSLEKALSSRRKAMEDE